MGIIYEVIKKAEEDFYSWDTEEDNYFVSFYLFIELLELYTDDRKELIIDYLINDDEFLKLNFYQLGFKTLDKNGVEIDEESIDENTGIDSIKSLDHTLTYIKYSYDAYEYDDPQCFPTEDYLSLVLENNVNDSFDDMYWKVEDILKLNCIIDIGLDATLFNEHREAMSSNARTILNYIRERKEFKERLIAEQVRSSRSQNIDPNVYDITVKQLTKKEEEIKGLLNKIEHLEQTAIANNDKAMHPRTANTVSKIIAALTSELLNMDLTQPFANDSNGKIMAAIEKQGNTVSKDVIANWLKLAHENSM